ncbi:MAG TPA: hypothetical protein VMA34_08350 [Terracidiphilus sp.]|nr:hypothetical protein [Terracidiphilus sp.]
MSTTPKTHGIVYRIVRWFLLAAVVAVVGLGALIAIVLIFPLSQTGKVQDEAMLAGRTVESLPGTDIDYFHDMDNGIKLTREQVIGRDNWIVWTGGNDRFWDRISVQSVGILDLLKTISDYPGLPATRANRWEFLGLVNEPCYEAAMGPDPNRWGLWLDHRKPGCGPDPFEDATKYPGVKIGARGKTVEVGSYYGYGTGIVGLRLFPNPAFNEKAKEHWDAKRYYTDPSYYNDAKLVKPYRVGMSCGFCHVGPNPIDPPADPNNPEWKNLSSMVGAQYFWVDRIFSWSGNSKLYFYQLFHTARPGSLDTSLVSTDNINNPRTMNAVYDLGPRLTMALQWGQEKLAGGQLDNKQFNDYVPPGDPLTQFFMPPDTVRTPHVLKDGSDSVGALGALNRVYLNIGLFSEEWLLHFNALIGGKKVTPITIKVAEKNSVYWKATEAQTPNLARFMLVSTDPHYLAEAPGGKKYQSSDKALLTRGKIVFADRCARCHSSKLPDFARGQGLANCAGSNYLACFINYFKLTQTDDFRAKMRTIVLADDFLKDNFLSTDARIPVTLLGTNACSPLATNALADNIWDNFSSQSYKDLPSVGPILARDPYTDKTFEYQMPAGGRGYTRPASLVSVWSTAPLLLNNTVGHFESSPSVDARMQSFNDSIHQLLWPETRAKDSDQIQNLPMDVHYLSGPGPSLVDRMTERSYVNVAYGYLPWPLSASKGLDKALAPWLFDDNGARIGPFPAGTPVDVIANIDLLGDSGSGWARFKRDASVIYLLLKYQHAVGDLPQSASDDQLETAFETIEPKLASYSKCPDFVVNKGHYFGTAMFNDLLQGPALKDSGIQPEPALSDSDKEALIEFLKTF